MKMDILVAAAANAATNIAAANTGATPLAAIFFDAGVCSAHYDVILQRFIPVTRPSPCLTLT